jgi:hypothetical protein
MRLDDLLGGKILTDMGIHSKEMKKIETIIFVVLNRYWGETPRFLRVSNIFALTYTRGSNLWLGVFARQEV